MKPRPHSVGPTHHRSCWLLTPWHSTAALLLPSTATHCGTQNDKAVHIPMLLTKLQHLL